MLAGARRHKIGNADVDTDHGRIRWCLDGHFLIIGERKPPHAITLIELHTAVELLHLVGLGVREGALVIRRQFDRHLDWLTLLKGADDQPVIIG